LNVINEGQWMFSAACRNEDPALFYDADNEGNAARLERTQKARAVCYRCPVRKQCLDTALNNQEAYGMWGGMTAPERWQLAKFLKSEESA
jgi:WhiB family redox-sensing transcriptional regulator